MSIDGVGFSKDKSVAICVCELVRLRLFAALPTFLHSLGQTQLYIWLLF